MLKTIYKLWWKKPSQLRAVPAFVYASDESSARTKLAARIAASATILDQALTIDPSEIGVGSLTYVGPLSQSSTQPWRNFYPISRSNFRPQDTLTPADIAELEADLAT